MILDRLASLIASYPITFVVFILIGLLIYNMKKADRRKQKSDREFYERERAANATRRKPLDNVDFVVIPYDELPMELEKDDEAIATCIHDIELLRGDKIANFTGKTNTDLKLEYGAPNITLLSRYDANFTMLCRILADWSERLYELEHYEEALYICEFAIKIRSDVSATYYLCGELYEKLDRMNKIPWLKRSAEGIDTLMKNSIIRTLNERYPDILDSDTLL